VVWEIAALARRLHTASATAPGRRVQVKLNYSWLALFSISFVLVTNGAKPRAFAASDSLPVGKITLPAGFEIKLYAQVPNARSMTLSPPGTLFVGSRSGGKV